MRLSAGALALGDGAHDPQHVRLAGAETGRFRAETRDVVPRRGHGEELHAAAAVANGYWNSDHFRAHARSASNLVVKKLSPLAPPMTFSWFMSSHSRAPFFHT
jgi:hypothetical protein